MGLTTLTGALHWCIFNHLKRYFLEISDEEMHETLLEHLYNLWGCLNDVFSTICEQLGGELILVEGEKSTVTFPDAIHDSYLYFNFEFNDSHKVRLNFTSKHIFFPKKLSLSVLLFKFQF